MITVASPEQLKFELKVMHACISVHHCQVAVICISPELTKTCEAE